MTRVAFKMKLKSGCADEYQKRHNNIWPEVQKNIRSRGITDYSIFLDPESNTLIAFQIKAEVNPPRDECGVEVLSKWWEHMADLMETNPDNSPVTKPLAELFYMQ